MGGWDGRCRLLRLQSLSDCYSLTWDLLGSRKYPQQKAAGENAVTHRHKRTSAHGLAGFVVLGEQNTHTLTLWLCKSCERRSTGSISPSFRCVRLLVGSLECLCWGVSHVGESGRLRHMWTLLCLVDMFLLNTTRFVLFVVCAEERWDIFLRANLRCCYIQSLKSDMFEEKHSMLTLASLSFSCLFTVMWCGLI